MRFEVQARLEIGQRSLGKIGLGAHGNIPNEGVQGNMGGWLFGRREKLILTKDQDTKDLWLVHKIYK